MLQLCELDRGPGEELVAFVAEMPELPPLVVGWANFFGRTCENLDFGIKIQNKELPLLTI